MAHPTAERLDKVIEDLDYHISSAQEYDTGVADSLDRMRARLKGARSTIAGLLEQHLDEIARRSEARVSYTDPGDEQNEALSYRPHVTDGGPCWCLPDLVHVPYRDETVKQPLEDQAPINDLTAFGVPVYIFLV